MTHIMLAPPVKRRHEGDPESDSGLSTNAPTGHRIKSMKQHLEADVTGSLTPQVSRDIRRVMRFDTDVYQKAKFQHYDRRAIRQAAA